MRKLIIIALILAGCRDFDKEHRDKGYNYVIYYNVDKTGQYQKKVYAREIELKDGCVLFDDKVLCGNFTIENI